MAAIQGATLSQIAPVRPYHLVKRVLQGAFSIGARTVGLTSVENVNLTLGAKTFPRTFCAIVKKEEL